MSIPERQLAATILIEGARTFADAVETSEAIAFGDAPDEVWNEWERESSQRAADPQAWMRTTKLYRKLTKKIKPDMRVDDNR